FREPAVFASANPPSPDHLCARPMETPIAPYALWLPPLPRAAGSFVRHDCRCVPACDLHGHRSCSQSNASAPSKRDIRQVQRVVFSRTSCRHRNATNRDNAHRIEAFSLTFEMVEESYSELSLILLSEIQNTAGKSPLKTF